MLYRYLYRYFCNAKSRKEKITTTRCCSFFLNILFFFNIYISTLRLYLVFINSVEVIDNYFKDVLAIQYELKVIEIKN